MANPTISTPMMTALVAPAERRSGYTFMGPETRAMQDDDTTNPGMLGVIEGEALWNRKAGAAGKAAVADA